jgi:hypothetical protein
MLLKLFTGGVVQPGVMEFQEVAQIMEKGGKNLDRLRLIRIRTFCY